MAQDLTWVRGLMVKDRNYKAVSIEDLKPGLPVVYLDRNDWGNYAPGWAVVKKIYPGGRVLIDPYMGGEEKRVSTDVLMDGEWVHDMPRRHANPCSSCGHSNHDGSACNQMVEVEKTKKCKECLCKHDMREVQNG